MVWGPQVGSKLQVVVFPEVVVAREGQGPGRSRPALGKERKKEGREEN